MGQHQISLRSSTTKPVSSPATRSYLYQRLMQVSIRHTFFNASLNLCPVFSIVPTSASMQAMKSMGLLFRYEVSGFSILLDQNQEQSFSSYLQTQAPDGTWTRLSFTLTTSNPRFVNFTDMPIDVPFATTAFYFSNIDATVNDNGEVCLNPNPLTGSQELPLTGSQYCVSQPRAASRQVVVKDISGAIVLWKKIDPGIATYLDLAALPEDKYLIEECVNQPSDCSASTDQEVIYSYSVPSAMFFLDLLFTQPAGTSTGVYPVEFPQESGTMPITSPPRIAPTQYFLNFTPRATIWNYYIVSTGAALTDLQVESIGPSTSQPITFTGPVSVTLPNQQAASLFVSTAPIPLQEQSACNFQLKGKAGGLEMKNGVLMNRLPVASSQQVIPGQSDFASSGGAPSAHQTSGDSNNYSDIYVYI